MIEKQFVQENINKVKLAEFLDEELERANYSHIDFTKTSTSTNITLYSEKPGLIIGRGGHRIKELIQMLKDDFGIENPQVEAKEVEEPDLNAEVVAKNVASWLEKGGFPKRVGNTYARRVMEAGAAGVQIVITGKLSGSRGRSSKFTRGYIKKCGDTANEYVDYAYRDAVTKPGALGVKVYIMKEIPEYMTQKKVQELEETVEDEEEEGEQEAEEESEREEDEAEETEEEPEDETEESEAEATEEEVDYDAVVTETVDDVKEKVADEDIDFSHLMAAEKNNKDRKTLKRWIKRRRED